MKWFLKYEKSYTCTVDNAGVQTTQVPSREELGYFKNYENEREFYGHILNFTKPEEVFCRK